VKPIVPGQSSSKLVLSMWPSKRKLDQEKSKHAGLAQQNGFGPAFFPEAGVRHSRA
jgi:hypothetical protein